MKTGCSLTCFSVLQEAESQSETGLGTSQIFSSLSQSEETEGKTSFNSCEGIFMTASATSCFIINFCYQLKDRIHFSQAWSRYSTLQCYIIFNLALWFKNSLSRLATSIPGVYFNTFYNLIMIHPAEPTSACKICLYY